MALPYFQPPDCFPKKKNRLRIPIICILLFLGCKSDKNTATYSSEQLRILPLSPKSFIHISYLDSGDYGRVACNGLIYAHNGKAVIFDTPVSSASSEELISYLKEEMYLEIYAIVVNHFHVDGMGGLRVFHENAIPSYANSRTLDLAVEHQLTVPENGFEQIQDLWLDDKKITNRYFGEAHSPDNIVSYIPDEKLLYGGCMLKALKAGKGNLADANVAEWSQTIRKIRSAFPEVEIAVPGHGRPGGSELLDYTEHLFSTE